MTTPLEKCHTDDLNHSEKSKPNDPMAIAELYADGIVDLSLKLQKGESRSARPSLITKDDIDNA